jgi:hypothetical protein
MYNWHQVGYFARKAEARASASPVAVRIPPIGVIKGCSRFLVALIPTCHYIMI